MAEAFARNITGIYIARQAKAKMADARDTGADRSSVKGAAARLED